MLTPLRLRLLAVFSTCLIFVAALATLAYIVSGAIGSMATTADQMDDARALAAANGALEAMQKQLGATVRDNAFWDDAYTSLNGADAKAWAAENWGVTTADYPLYDTALVIEPNSRSLIAYHKGAELTDAEVARFFLGNLPDILQSARLAGQTAAHLPVSYVKTRDGVALIGAALIQPTADGAAFDPAMAKILVFSKQLTIKVVSEIATTFSIKGLQLSEASEASNMLHADVLDINGREIYQVTWPALHPGTASYDRISPTLKAVSAAFFVLLAGLGVCGFVIFRSLRKGATTAEYKAKHDALTGLWNRAGFAERLEGALAGAQRAQTAVYILDLDGFKPVNDAWGHPVGDELIKAVASRLLHALPSTTAVARLGGDEFAFIRGVAVPDMDARPIHERILGALAAPFMIGGRTIEIGGSVGWSQFDSMALDGVELLRRADLALYRAKDMGRGVAVAYEAALDEAAREDAELEQEMRQALAKSEIKVAFQPLIDATTRHLTGVEALARWTSPTRGPITPDIFIAIAEKTGLIDELGFQVLTTAIGEAARWPDISIAVNISPLQLRNPYFCRQVEELLRKSRFDPARLMIEVTEGVLIANPDQAKRAFKGLRQLGVKIALDDFGCGYASIGTLREFGFDRMKIDRSLVLGLGRDENGSAVLQATVALANALHLPVTAEGIETEEQATAVRLSGCDKLQGFLFSKPVSADEISKRYFNSEQCLRQMKS